jgi:hypothetical protein
LTLEPLKMTEHLEIKGVIRARKSLAEKLSRVRTSAHIPDAPKQSVHYVEITDTVRVAVRNAS